MSALPVSPLTEAMLRRYQLRAQRQFRSGLSGGHLTRRQGQSLEFREFTTYIPGDDIRHVDWRASSRYGGEYELLVRKFVAEEQYSLVISLDTRATMQLPPALPKLQIANWLAEAIAWVALRSGDRVILHQLFAASSQPPVVLRGSAGLTQIRSGLARCQPPAKSETGLEAEALNLNSLRPFLPPTAIWLIVTDLYFTAPQAEQLAERIVQAQNGFRQVLLVELDSWEHERALVGLGPRLIEGPGLAVERPHYEIGEAELETVATTIRQHKQRFLDRLHRNRVDSRWNWPTTPIDHAAFFQAHFLEDRALQSLFERKSA